MDVTLLLSLVCVCTAAGSGTLRSSWPLVLSDGLCQTRDSQGRCRPMCVSGCKHGECVGPDQCHCHPGFTGKTCNRDVNECALRPCKYRCMNTHGSFKCYCLNGFMAAADGSCRNARTCAMANCQYGCAVMKGEVTCQCPSPGLRLAPDGRTCVDVDECVTGQAKCARFRKCVNTFGSFVCRCHDGFVLKHIDGKYRCTDKKRSSVCYDKPGHKKCKCTPGVNGKGNDCKSVVKVIIEPARPVKATASPTTVYTATTPMATTKEKTTTTTAIAIPTTIVTTETSVPKSNAVTKVTPTTVAMTTTESTTTTALTTTESTTTTAPTTALTTTESTTTTAPTTALTTTESTTTTALTTTESTTTTAPTTALTTTESTTKTAPTTALTTTESTTTTAPTTAPTTALTTTESSTTKTPTTTLTTTESTTTTTLTTTESTTTTVLTTTESSTTKTPTTALTTTESSTTTTLTTTESTTTTVPTTTESSKTSSTTTLDNRVHRESTVKPRGDVHIPRYESNLFDWDFDVELGNTAEYVRDDPAAGVVSCSFDKGLCLWMKDSEGDLRWEIKDDPAGGRYLSVPEATNRRSVKGARLTVPLATPTKVWQGGDLCLGFRHRLHGNHIGSLQVFVRKGRSHSPSVWTMTRGHGWRHTHITLGGRGLVDIVLKAERRRGKLGEISVDDFSLRRGACSDGDNRTDQ